MAKPIKETPVLTGKDAKKFNQANQQVVKETKEVRDRIKTNFATLQSISKF